MHNPDLERFIPEAHGQEYRPAGYPALSAYRLAWLKLCWGANGMARRVWVNPSGGEEPLVLDVLVDQLHCSEDALNIIEASRPASIVLAELANFDPVFSEQGRGPGHVVRWQTGGLKAESRTVPSGGGLVCSALAIGRDSAAIGSILDAIIDQTALSADTGGTNRRRCSYGFRRFLWSLAASAVLLIPAIFIPGGLVSVFAPDPVPLLVIIGATVVSAYALTRWSQRNRLGNQRKYWGSVLAQGDPDGTIRRALASIGIELPEAAPPWHKAKCTPRSG